MTSGIIALSGPRACGKSTIAEHLCSTYGYTRIAFADAVRNVARCANPDLQDDRMFLADLGQVLRNCVPGFTILAVEHSLKEMNGPVVIEDIRFPTEMEFCRTIGAINIRLEIDQESQIRRMIDRGDEIGKVESLLNSKDESRLKNTIWDFTISATGDFKHIATKIHEINRGVESV
jgi:dephospho-CoA kinase